MACNNQHHAYSEADNDWFRAHYARASTQEALARFPGRTWNSLKNQACRLGAVGRRHVGRKQVRTVWTDERENQLRALYPLHGSLATAALLGITRESVRGAASRLHLKAPARKKAVKPVVVKRAPRVVVVKPPKPARVLAVKRSAGTPVLNAAKEARRQSEEKPKRAAVITADEVRKLPYHHGGRMAYMLHGQAGWQQWKQQQPGS